MSDPGFTFYADNFMGATYLWTDAEVGQYIRALCLQKLNGHLSFNDLNTCVKSNEKILNKFSKDSEDRYFNVRLQKEIDKRLHHCELQRDRINKRWKKEHTAVLPGNESGNTTSGIETEIVFELKKKEKDCKGKEREKGPDIPDHLSEVWPAFLEVRKAKKAVNTPRALRMILTELDRLSKDKAIQVKIVEQSIRASWKDVYQLKESEIKQMAQRSARDREEDAQYEKNKQLQAEGRL